MSNWKVEFDEKAKSELLKLDKPVQKRIVKFIEERLLARTDPRSAGASLIGSLSGLWKYRVGDYRLICKIQDEVMTVIVISVGHRKQIYQTH